ncbi:MAG: hypothetical protein V1766_07935 [Pseudomonadota bacterium]
MTIPDQYGMDAGFNLTHERVIASEDIEFFAKVSGDFNAVHTNDDCIFNFLWD